MQSAFSPLTYSHAVKHLSAVVDRGDFLGRQNRTDVFTGELLHCRADSLLLAVPPQTHHGRQVLHCAVVHTASQVGELPLNANVLCSQFTAQTKMKNSDPFKLFLNFVFYLQTQLLMYMIGLNTPACLMLKIFRR